MKRSVGSLQERCNIDSFPNFYGAGKAGEDRVFLEKKTSRRITAKWQIVK